MTDKWCIYFRNKTEFLAFFSFIWDILNKFIKSSQTKWMKDSIKTYLVVSTLTYQWTKWPQGKTARGSGSSGPRWESVCIWSRLRVRTCWAGLASRWGCTWCCTCWARPGWWSLWHSPGRGTAESGQGMLAGCWEAGYPRTRSRCLARGLIRRLSSRSWCGVRPDRGQRSAGSCWGRNSPDWSRSAPGTLTGTC